MTPTPPSPTPTTEPAAARWGRITIVLAALVVLLLAVIALRMFVGYIGMDQWPRFVEALKLRWQSVTVACCVGAALAAGGVSLQALLRNPLAEPFILGLSTGAGVGLFVQRVVSAELGVSPGAEHLGAAAGAMLSMAIVYLGGRRRGVIDPLGLLLVGVVLGTINGAIIMFLNYFRQSAGNMETEMFARWMMGNLNPAVDPLSLWIVIGVTLGGIAILFWQGRAMDVATFSDAEAEALGVNVARMRAMLFVVSGLLAAGAVVLSGPVAFVGLICPHAARLLLGPGHRALVIGSALLGAALIVAADSASVVLDRTLETGLLPLGIFTAVIGGLTFLWMVRPQIGRGLGGG